MRSTYTYVTLEVPKEFYEFVADKLKEAGYTHAFHEGGIIDLHGLALKMLVVAKCPDCDGTGGANQTANDRGGEKK